MCGVSSPYSPTNGVFGPPDEAAEFQNLYLALRQYLSATLASVEGRSAQAFCRKNPAKRTTMIDATDEVVSAPTQSNRRRAGLATKSNSRRSEPSKRTALSLERVFSDPKI